MKILRNLLFLALSLLLVLPAMAETAADGKAAEPMEAVQESVPATLRSPRATMTTFLHAMNDIKRGEPEKMEVALTTLDLSGINPLVQTEKGTELAWALLEIMDKTRVVQLKKVPDYEEGKPWVFEKYEGGVVEVVRMSDGRWLLSQMTLAAVPAIFDELADKKKLKIEVKGEAEHLPLALRIRNQIPNEFKHKILTLEGWQWIAILLIIMLGVLIDKLISLFLRGVMANRVRHSKSRGYKGLRTDMLRPFGLLGMALVWWVGINQLGLSEKALLVLLVAVKFLTTLSAVWGAFRLADLLDAFLKNKAEKTASKLDDQLAPLATRSLKVFIFVIGLIFVANSLNLDIRGLLAGLGLGGLAFALAAKDLVQNLFGSITVLFDRPFYIGDWIVVGDVEGTVEDIGFRTTRIRTFYNSVITLPNSHLITASVDNMGSRRYRRYTTKLGLTYDTPPAKIEAFCEGVRELVRLHPYMRKDYYHVYFSGYADSALEVMLYVFWETPDWSTELREKHRFLLDILRLAQDLGVEFAYPTQTVFWKEMADADSSNPGGVDAEIKAAHQTARDIVDKYTGVDVTPPPTVIEEKPLSR